METTTAAKIVGPKDGKSGFLGSIGVRFMIDGVDADDRFSLVEHPMYPRALAAPLNIPNCRRTTDPRSAAAWLRSQPRPAVLAVPRNSRQSP